MSENTTPNSCGSMEARPSALRPVVPPAHQHRWPQHRRVVVLLRGVRRFSQGNEVMRRFQKRYKVLAGRAKQRHAKKFKQNHTPVGTVRSARPREQASQNQDVERREPVMSEERINWQNNIISQLATLRTLRRELSHRMNISMNAMSTAAEDPVAAIPRITAAAAAQREAMNKLIEMIQRIDDSGLGD